MKAVIIRFLIIILLLFSGNFLQGGHFTFRKYQVNEGLSENTVICILQDHQGFMWFGTKDGLNRFDGREFKVYRHDPSDPSTIGNNFIRDLYQHIDSTIWIGTDLGVYIYNPKTDAFTRFNKTTAANVKIRSNVNSIAFDGNNSIWFGTRSQGAFRYNISIDELIQFKSNDQRNSLQSNLVWKVYADMSGVIWLGTRNGFSRFNSETNTFFTYAKTGGAGNLVNAEVLTIFEDSDGDLWLGTWSGGLSRLNRSTNTFRTFLSSCSPPLASHIRSIFEYEKNKLLIGSDDGLYLLNKATDEVRRIDDPKDHNSLSDQNVYSIQQDREGGLWFGTYFGGVNYVSSLSKHIQHFYPSFAPYSMSGKAVSQFLEDKNGNLWIATEDGGLNYFDKATRRFEVFLPDGSGNSLSYHNIHSLLMVGEDLWIGTFSRGIDVFNLKTNRFKNFRHLPDDDTTIDDDCVFALFNTRGGDVLIGTPFGLSKYNPETDNFERIKEIRAFVYKIKEDHLGNIWIASYGDGIFRYCPEEGLWHNYLHDPSNPRSIGYDKVIEIYLDNQQRLWFGTESYGLFRYNYETNDFLAINEKNGLSNNTVYGILDDKYGNIWISTNSGIAKVNPNTLQVKTYNQSDGLQSDQFNYRSSFKSSDGTFYFGGVNGFNAFNPDNLKLNQFIPPVVITNIELLDVESPSEQDFFLIKDFRSGKKITLKHNRASIRISFVSLSFMSPEKNEFAFKMENYTQQWMHTNDHAEATYINLPPGKYVFRVKGTNNDGLWNETGDYLHIEVLPPFYRTIYAYLIYVIAIFAALLVLIKYYYKLAKERQQKKLDAFQKEKEMEVYNSKINFFTSIAHEIRTPVSLIKAPLECIINSNEGNPDTKENLKVIERNTERLIQLINQLLDFRKIEEKLYKLNLSQVNVNELINEICYRFKPTADKSGIELIIEIPDGVIFAHIDREAVTKIVSNLLSNAVKFTRTHIRISLCEDHAGSHFIIRVEDNGEGISEKYKEKVFEPFFQIQPAKLSDQKPGTGIGLALTRQLVERQNGVIYIEDSLIDEGSVFVVTLPKLEGIPSNDVISLTQKSDKDLIEVAEELAEESKLTLMIVEDNKDLLDFMRKNLKNDFQVVLAENGQEALDLIEKCVVDIIVSDVMMPVLDGVELVNQIKQDEHYCHIPIILLSARTNNETKIEGLESGADCYIEKPFSIEFLKAQINSLVKNRLMMQEKFANSPFLSFGAIASNKKDEEFINRLNQELEENLTDSEYSIEILAQSLSMSRSNLQRKIKGLTGMPPNDYIRVFRLKKAAILLQTSNYRINEICYLVGFNNPSYFSKCFQKQFGSLPKEFAVTIQNKPSTQFNPVTPG
jgi:ligand-binding sensor domain-containing protein/signal transduction histidine kinase/DNA-binding response OmpR family regulator